MKLLVLSDLHLEVAAFDVPAGADFDVAVLAGDIGAPGDAAVRWMQSSAALQGKDVVFVPGNHEYYGSNMDAMLERMRFLVRDSRVHLLDGDAVRLDGVRFLGATLWTDFELEIAGAQGLVHQSKEMMRTAALGFSDYCQICTTAGSHRRPADRVERMLRPQDTVRIHEAQRAWLLMQLAQPFSGKTVVVTHHAPHRGSLAPGFAQDPMSAAFISDLPPLFFAVPVLWVHGHTHTCFDYVVNGTRIVCNARGYARAHATSGFKPAWVVDI